MKKILLIIAIVLSVANVFGQESFDCKKTLNKLLQIKVKYEKELLHYNRYENAIKRGIIKPDDRGNLYKNSKNLKPYKNSYDSCLHVIKKNKISILKFVNDKNNQSAEFVKYTYIDLMLPFAVFDSRLHTYDYYKVIQYFFDNNLKDLPPMELANKITGNDPSKYYPTIDL